MNKKERVLCQIEISRKALVRALDSIGEDVVLLRFIPKRNAFRKKQELASKIMSTWSFPEPKRSESEDDSDFFNGPDPSVLFELAARSLNQTLFGRIQGSVHIYTMTGKFLYYVSGVSYETFRKTVSKHSRVVCSMNPKHDEYFESMVKEKKSIARFPFYLIISTNGDSIATLRALREKVLVKP